MKQSKPMRISLEAYELVERFAESDDRGIGNAVNYLIKQGYKAEKERESKNK